ncbi:electron transfer flavoprotein subunit beta/FixA family protein [Adlercreutzia sp. R21]|uniref:Electron transfer flavoprotein subunit beta/FixA family protein n=1 Tax=Adlercreutzia wanghongyangiae TaxID=3111451 RepID=A0ABU6IHB7_9ACTN|nr:electron transfer flavoprotein subunit beta/FixA family protein [Adlercreutzia sp. R21]MEC4175819.1 electron transfer flavoprotein subunit beta/FixA family protein [Adlercreutzia sp. R7]MEC4183232.1 electron transfer flavoprotein subunit beta/FixA family protein [Adlercreutzia sp. R21]
MNIVVCVKQVIDTEAVIELDGEGAVSLEGQTLVIDPYSEFAVERAVQITEEQGGTVTLVCLGDAGCASALRHGLAMGASEAVLLEDDGWLARDAAEVAAALAEAIRPLGADLIMGGWKSGDTAAAQVMGRVATLLDLPLANMATSCEVVDGGIRVLCEVDDGVEASDLPLPAVVAAQQGLAEPRYPSVRDVMGARRKKIDTRPAAVPDGSGVVVLSRELKPARTGGRIVEGAPAEAVAETVRLLAEEAKVL